MSKSVQAHRADSPDSVRCGLITVSDTRTLATDTGGQCAADLLTQAGHLVPLRLIVPDEPERLRDALSRGQTDPNLDALLFTGGTGISSRDQTLETIRAALTKELPGYGELFRMLSYAQIGAAAMLSRAIGGLVGRLVVLTMPGSPDAVRLAMEKLILPELAHLVREARR